VSNAVDNLLTLLCSGDPLAAEETFRRFEPFLRRVVRHGFPPGLRAKFDSEDIVQSVWATLLPGFRQAGWRFSGIDHLRAFLAKATRNRLMDRIRQHCGAARNEWPLADLGSEMLPARAPRPSQFAQREELWQQILALCLPEHQELVRLKREGLSLDEIALRTGLHRDSVRRVLRTLARRLAFGKMATGRTPGPKD